MTSPAPAPLNSLSPTQANALESCGYQVAFRLDERFKALRRPTPPLELGTVIHRFLEALAKGLLAGCATDAEARAVAEERWSELEAQAIARLGAAWAPAAVPGPADWNGYFLNRARAITRAVARPRLAPVAATRVQHSSVLVEQELRDDEHGLIGTPDRVEGPAGDRCVVDLKTGLRQDQPTDSQRRQLLLYVHLVGLAEGNRPQRAAIENAAGRRWEIEVDGADVDAAVAHALGLRDAFQEHAAAGTLAELASPDADTCRFCDFRIACTPYWEALQLGWDHGSLEGQVVEVSVDPAGAKAAVMVSRPGDVAGQIWEVSLIPQAQVPAVGAVTRFIGAEVVTARLLRWRWSTLACKPSQVTSV